MKLYIKQKALSLKDQYSISDEKGEELYFAKGSARKGMRLTLYTAAQKAQDQQELGQLKRKRLSMAPCYRIYVSGEQIATIKMAVNAKDYKVSGLGWKVKGNRSLRSYEISKGLGKIASISKKAFTVGDAYELDVREESELLPALLILLAIDECWG